MAYSKDEIEREVEKTLSGVGESPKIRASADFTDKTITRIRQQRQKASDHAHAASRRRMIRAAVIIAAIVLLVLLVFALK